MNGTKPPRGAVTITTEPIGPARFRFTATCTACGWTYSNLVKSDVEQHKRWHHCPERPA